MTRLYAAESNFPGPEEPVPQPPQPELPPKKPSEPEFPSPDPERAPFPGPGPTDPGLPQAVTYQAYWIRRIEKRQAPLPVAPTRA